MKNLCLSCREYKEEEEFNWKFKPLGVRATSCRGCAIPFRKKWYEGHKERRDAARTVAREYVWEYLSNHRCT